jgi:predicted RNA binding protein YcfA (HicA-like mRNA interferase family)
MLARKSFWMPKLPVVSGEVVIKALSKIGFIFRKGKGDHVIIQSKDGYRNIVVPLHKELKPGTLRAIIKQSRCHEKSSFGHAFMTMLA